MNSSRIQIIQKEAKSKSGCAKTAITGAENAFSVAKSALIAVACCLIAMSSWGQALQKMPAGEGLVQKKAAHVNDTTYYVKNGADSMKVVVKRPAQTQALKPKTIQERNDSLPWLDGMQVYANLAGIILWQASNYGEIEGGLRLDLKGKYFPTVEAGMGLCDKTDDETDIHFKTTGPFLRLGCDYNFARDKVSSNRIFGGFRVGITSFKFDLDGPTMADPYWHGQQMEINFKDQSANAAWGELVFGLQTKIWRWFHLGWTARYKRRLKQKVSDVGKAWYLPGYGKNQNHLFTGTFNAVIDL